MGQTMKEKLEALRQEVKEAITSMVDEDTEDTEAAKLCKKHGVEFVGLYSRLVIKHGNDCYKLDIYGNQNAREVENFEKIKACGLDGVVTRILEVISPKIIKVEFFNGKPLDHFYYSQNPKFYNSLWDRVTVITESLEANHIKLTDMRDVNILYNKSADLLKIVDYAI